MTDRDPDSDPLYSDVLPSRHSHDVADDEWVDPQEVLDRLRVLPVRAWREPADDPGGVHHLAPAAEDFYEAFEVGSDPNHIHPGDPNGVVMAAIQGLADRLDDQHDSLEQQRQRTQRQREIMEEQRADIEILREKLESVQSEVFRLRLGAEEGD